MINKLSKFIILTLIIGFFVFVVNYYLSEKNIHLVKNNRSLQESKIPENFLDLPILLNDTNDVIEFNSGFENSKKETFKRNFWELFK